MRPRYLSLIILSLLSLCACSKGEYPKEWSSPRAGFWSFLVNEGCPDIQGTWDIKSNSPWPLFGLISGNKRSPFETLTITGDSHSELTLELKFSFASLLEKITAERKKQIEKGYGDHFPEAKFLKRMDPKVRTSPPYDTMTDAQYAADLAAAFPAYTNRTLILKAKRDREYVCKNGWLVELYSNDPEKHEGSTFSVGINAYGDLLRKGERTEKQYFRLGWGDHVRDLIRFPNLHIQWWDRKVPIAPIVEPSPPWKVPFTPIAKPNSTSN